MLEGSLGWPSKLTVKGFGRIHSFNLTTSEGGKISWDGVNETVSCGASVEGDGGGSIKVIKTRAKFEEAHDGAVLAMNEDGSFLVSVHGNAADLTNGAKGKDGSKRLRIKPNFAEVR